MRQAMPISRHREAASAAAPPPTVSSEYLRVFATGAEARGLHVQPIFAASGIDDGILGRPGARVGVGAAVEAWQRCTNRLGDPLFGLTLGETLPVGAISRLDFLVLSSANVGDALTRIARYAPLMANTERLSLTVEGDEARFQYHNENNIPYGIEMIVGMFAMRARELFGPSWSVKRICFAHARLGPRAAYDRICQAPVMFEMPVTEVVFARDLTALPMAGADARLHAIVVAEAEAALATLTPAGGGPSFIDTVKRVLEDGLHQRDLTLTRLAEQLGVSTRTLQRRLRAAGVTHRRLVSDVRKDLAARSLATRVSQRQIARTLGYSGRGAFQRAFKRWSGVTPGQLRGKPAESR
jgi:AraC-like DNA-binding protein